MDEPMDAAVEADSTQPDLEPDSNKKSTNPLLRPGSMGTNKIDIQTDGHHGQKQEGRTDSQSNQGLHCSTFTQRKLHNASVDATRQNGAHSVCDQCRPRSASASSQSDQGLHCSPFTQRKLHNASVDATRQNGAHHSLYDQCRPRSACASSQSARHQFKTYLIYTDDAATRRTCRKQWRGDMRSPHHCTQCTVMMTITEEDYMTQYWPKLEQAIHQLLTMSPGQYIPISYEQMYSCVYKCVCKQFSERLYGDLLHYMGTHLDKLCQELKAQMQNPSTFIERFAYVVNQYIQALSGIVPIFNYMNRFYIETKLRTDLNEELRKLFRSNVVDVYVAVLLPLLEEANSNPFSVSPPTMCSLLKNLHLLNPEYAKLKPELFSKYIPNILPPTMISELDQYVEETKIMQQEIHCMPGFQLCDSSSSKKRTNEDTK